MFLYIFHRANIDVLLESSVVSYFIYSSNAELSVAINYDSLKSVVSIPIDVSILTSSAFLSLAPLYCKAKF